MENFQLFRTNILLGGQMKWDLILDSQEDVLIVSDFHLSPISSSSPYNRYSDESLLNYSHSDNIKKFYKDTEGLFFNNCIDARLSHPWPIISNEETNELIYDKQFEAGARYAHYSLYNKTFECFCPLWLEQLSSTDILSFKLNMYTGEKKVGSKIIRFSGKFSTYFKNYIKHIQLSDDLISINLNNKTAYINGLDLMSGNIVKKDISSLISNLMYRERPMMEFDSMIINQFADNHLIAKQLFNFSFFFDLNDLLSEYLTNLVYGSEVRFEIKAMINGKELEMRDFYSNYESIPKYDVGIKTLTESLKPHDFHNVMDYLMDYRYNSHIGKNKYIQNTIHWSICDNPDYIFNLYNGFAPFTGSDKELQYFSHQYNNAPDLISKTYNDALNNAGWCSVYKLTYEDWMELVRLDKDDFFQQIQSKTTDFLRPWVNNIRYSHTPTDIEWSALNVCILLVDEDKDLILSQLKSGMFSESELELIELKDNLYYVRLKKYEEMVAFVAFGDYDNITYRGMCEVLDNLSIELPSTHPLTYIKDKLNNAQQIPLVAIDKSLYIVYAPSPSTSSQEVEYYKDDNSDISATYVMRYDGNIKPTFLSKSDSGVKNVRYGKVQMTSNQMGAWNKYNHTGFPPLFPSIDYCAWKSEPITYSEPSLRAYIPEINVELHSKEDNEEFWRIKEVILEYIQQLYMYCESRADAEIIYNMYDVEYSFDYMSPTNIEEYKYQVKLVLK